MGAVPIDAERLSLARHGAVGLACTLVLGVVDPLCGFLATTPWTGWGLNGFVRAIMIAPFFGLIASTPLTLFLRNQRPWYPTYFKMLTWLLLVSWAVLMSLSCTYFFGLVSLHVNADSKVFGGVGFIGLAFGTIPAAVLIYMLRHPYWKTSSADVSFRRQRGGRN